MPVYVEINKEEHRRLLGAINRVDNAIRYWGTTDGGELNRRCAIGYSQMVLKNIMSMNRPSPPYSKRYRSWKYEYGRMGYPAPWRLFGDLIAALTFWRGRTATGSSAGRTGWYGGIPKEAMDFGGKSWFGKGNAGKSKSIAMYAAVNEARRPIFWPTLLEYAQTEWPKQADVAMRSIRREWR